MEKRESYNSPGSNIIHTSVDPVRVQVLAMIERMAMLLKFCQKQSLPTSNEDELPDAVRREVNSAVQKFLEEERTRSSGRKRKYTRSTPEDRAKLPITQLSVETQR